MKLKNFVFPVLLFLSFKAGYSEPHLLATFSQEGILSLGLSISSGDFNGDGFSDLLVGTMPNLTHRGTVYLFFGGKTLDTIPDLVFLSPDDPYFLDGFGDYVASAGDFNGDGYEDIAIGAPGWAYYSLEPGRVYLYFGGPELDDDYDLIFQGLDVYWHLGSVIKASDLNKDGYSDLVVSAPCGVVDATGHILVYFGGNPPDNVPDWRVDGPHMAESGLGTSLDLGDFNGDSWIDIVAGAPYNFIESDSVGRAFVFLNNPLDNIADLELKGEVKGFAACCASGNFNGDGFCDLVVGKFVFAYYGGSPMDTIADWRIKFDPYFASLSTGDINNDGFDDILSGTTNGGLQNYGLVKIYFGAADFDTTVDVTIKGENPPDLFKNVKVVGDVNGDGWFEFAVGAIGWNNYQGRVYLYTLNPDVGIQGEDRQKPTIRKSELQNSPNPFSSLTTIAYTLPTSSYINLSIYNLTGQLVETLVDREEGAGEHTIRWQGGNKVSAGVYFLRLRAGTVDLCKKIIILK